MLNWPFTTQSHSLILFFSTKEKNKLHIWDDPNSCLFFGLLKELCWGSFPLAQTQNLTQHKLCSYCCGLQAHLNRVQSPGAPRVQSNLCKHLQHHSQHLLENSDIHMPAMPLLNSIIKLCRHFLRRFPLIWKLSYSKYLQFYISLSLGMSSLLHINSLVKKSDYKLSLESRMKCSR